MVLAPVAGSRLDHRAKSPGAANSGADQRGRMPMRATAIRSDAPQPLANYSEAFRVGDLVGIVPGGRLKREVIRSEASPPRDAYSEAFRVGDLVFAAGRLASDGPMGTTPGSEIKRQTRAILEQLAKTFAAAGSGLEHAV